MLICHYNEYLLKQGLSVNGKLLLTVAHDEEAAYVSENIMDIVYRYKWDNQICDSHNCINS